MAERRNYSIKKNRYQSSFLSGFALDGEQKITCIPEDYGHYLILNQVDGVEEDAKWGRLKFDCLFAEDVIYTVYIFATNFEEFNRRGTMTGVDAFLMGEDTIETKKEFFRLIEAKKFINQNDLLLYDVQGRYLHIMIEVQGCGEGYIDNCSINSQGDFYMESLPEVYQEYGSFLHRYLSIFSSLFMDLQEKVETIDEIFDLDKTPINLLPIFGKWLGIDVSGDFLTEEKLRTLIKEAYMLNRMKGTRKALERLTEIILEEKVILLEKNQLSEDATELENFEELYGSGNHDVTMLIRSYVPENQKSQLLFLIKQFVPIRCNLNIRFLEDSTGLDDHMYMDVNTQISDDRTGELDSRQMMDGSILLQE